MADIAEKQEYFKAHLIVRHPEGKSEKFSLPEMDGPLLKIGRELDNDIVLTDGRSSRYHAELRRTSDGVQLKDLGSANGTQVSGERIKADVWQTITAGQMVQLGETRLYWEKAASSQSTVVMPVQRPPDTQISPRKSAEGAPPSPVASTKPLIPLATGGVIIVLLLAIIGAGLMFGWFSPTPETATQPPITATASEGRDTEGGLAQQTPGAAVPTNTPTPTGPQMAIPALDINSLEVRPFIFKGLLSRDKVALVLNIRVQNIGNLPFTISTDSFIARTLDDGTVLNESGGNLSGDALKRLGAINRFNNLNLPPGGSVVESVIFDLDPETYVLELVFKTGDLDPIILGLGTIQAGVELSRVLGTPVPEETVVASAGISTPEPTPSPTLPASIPAPQVVPRSALVGTIAYPVFNGNNFDLHLGSVKNGTTQFYHPNASQPAFNGDGSRIAFHSWAGDSRGIVTMDVGGTNGRLISNFVEDQLPTWTTDSNEIVMLSRRSGGRQSQLIKTDSATELGESEILGEGEYPTIGANGQMVFKGWGSTAFGLRIAADTMADVETVTNVDEDTAPALSPNGGQVVFMSKREGDWNIYLINIDGSGLQRLTDDAADDGLPTWSPDGNAIAFVSNRGGPWAVWAMTPDGAGKRQLFTMDGSPDGSVGTDTYASRGWAEERISWTKDELVKDEAE